jgi:hypothetical protein
VALDPRTVSVDARVGFGALFTTEARRAGAPQRHVRTWSTDSPRRHEGHEEKKQKEKKNKKVLLVLSSFVLFVSFVPSW